MSRRSKARYKGKAKGKPSGKGRRFSKPVREHVGKKHQPDLRKQATKRRHRDGAPPAEIEIIKGVARANYIPALKRIGTDEELDAALRAASTLAARTYLKLRTDRTEPKEDGTLPVISYTPENANEYFHANLPTGIVLALRWGSGDFLNLKNPTPALDANLQYVAALVMEVYGVIVLASIRHTPNPYTDGRFEDLGWAVSDEEDPDRYEKFGGWNLHNQIYLTRVANGVYHCKHRDFSYCGDILVSSYWLKEYGVDIHAVARATRAFNLGRSYASGHQKLPKNYARLIGARKMSRKAAIAKVIEGKMRAWDRTWSKSKGAKNAQERLDYLIKDKSKVQEPIDLFISIKSTEDLERRLIELDPGYGPLLAKGRRVYAELKKQHFGCGYSRSLNELLTEFEGAEAQAAAAKHSEDQERLAAAAKEESARKEVEMEELRAQNFLLVEANLASQERELHAKEEAKLQKDEMNKLETEYSELAEEKRTAALGAARQAMAQQSEILSLKDERAALIDAVHKSSLAPVLYAPDILEAALEAAHVLVRAGMDLSSLPKEAQPLVEIQPETRIKTVKARFHGRMESFPAIGKDGEVLEEANPIAGQVGLKPAIYRYVVTMISGLRQGAPGIDTSISSELLKGYEEVLVVHNAAMAIEKVDFFALEEASGRILASGRPRTGNEYCMKPKYLTIARHAADAGDLTALSYLKQCEEIIRRGIATIPRPSPSREITK